MSNGRRAEDENIGRAEKWAIYVKRYGVVGVATALAPFVAPYVGDYLINNSMTKTLAPIKKGIAEVKQEVAITRELLLKAGATRLVTAEDFNVLVRHRIRSQSLDKVKRVKFILDGKLSKGRKWKRIKNILFEETNVYVSEMKNYVHPNAGNIADFLAKTFPMKENFERVYMPNYSFLAHVKVIVEQKEPSDIIVNDFLEYMKSIQDDYFSDMYNHLKSLERGKVVGLDSFSTGESL